MAFHSALTGAGKRLKFSLLPASWEVQGRKFMQAQRQPSATKQHPPPRLSRARPLHWQDDKPKSPHPSQLWEQFFRWVFAHSFSSHVRSRANFHKYPRNLASGTFAENTGCSLADEVCSSLCLSAHHRFSSDQV